MLDGWTPDELSQFGHLLNRFTSAYDQVHDAWIADRAEKAVHRTEITEGISS